MKTFAEWLLREDDFEDMAGMFQKADSPEMSAKRDLVGKIQTKLLHLDNNAIKELLNYLSENYPVYKAYVKKDDVWDIQKMTEPEVSEKRNLIAEIVSMLNQYDIEQLKEILNKVAKPVSIAIPTKKPSFWRRAQ